MKLNGAYVGIGGGGGSLGSVGLLKVETTKTKSLSFLG
jgi:hypothetical protein